MWTIRRRIIGNGHFRTSIATFVSVMNLISMNVTRGIDRSPRWGSESGFVLVTRAEGPWLEDLLDPWSGKRTIQI